MATRERIMQVRVLTHELMNSRTKVAQHAAGGMLSRLGLGTQRFSQPFTWLHGDLVGPLDREHMP